MLVTGKRRGGDAAGLAHPDLAAASAIEGVGLCGHIGCAAEGATEEQGIGEENPLAPSGHPIASWVRVSSR